MSTELPLASIGPYEVLKLLGRGGFGTVYLALQKEPVRREVALKVLNPGMDFAEIRARFEVERETLNLMKHPGISMLLDAGVTEEGEPYFAMEYVPGVPIGAYLEKNDLGLRERLALFQKVCDAVQHAHNKGVIHRDLTANNVLVEDIDGQPSPKIIDFGIAKSIGSALNVSMHTSEGQAMGTPAYMSPEQAKGDLAQIDTRTDIYTLGVLLYQILTGTLPMTDDDLRNAGVRILQMICEYEPPLPSQRISSGLGTTTTFSLRGDLDWITSKAIEKDPKERYASVAELSEDIRRYLEDEPVIAGPHSTWYRVRKVILRNRAVFTGAAAVLLALVIGLIVSLKLFFQSSANAEDARGHLARFNHLSDVLLLESLREEWGELGPGRPESIEELEAWLARGEGLVDRIEVLRSALVVAEANSSTDSTKGDPSNAGEGFLARELRDLIAELVEFDESPSSALANVRSRLAWARVVEAETVGAHRDAWARAADTVRQDPRFGGLQLEPQIGIVPLGADPESGLVEFFLPRTGRAPGRGLDGRLIPHEEAGVVLVLLPGGPFELGSQKSNPDAPRYDEGSVLSETWQEEVDGEWIPRLAPVELAPFLISKYEISRAQWRRITAGEQPSATQGEAYEEFKVSDLCPVENVTWRRAREVLRQFDLELPTEAQWEYACRAGTNSPWYTGPEEQDLLGHANLADITARDSGLQWEIFDGAVLEDGYVYSSPIGTFEPNPFGLYDMHGNVFERCLEPFGHYDPAMMEGPTGFRSTREEASEVAYIIRGGAFRHRAVFARSHYRWKMQESSAAFDVGIRPVTALRP